MDPGYFQSKHFAVAAFVAALILVAGATALTLGNGLGSSFARGEVGCEAPTVAGSPTQPAREAQSSDGGKARDESFVVNASDLAAVDACVAVGEFILAPSEDDRVRVTVRVRSDAAEATSETLVETRFARGPDGLRLAVWEARVGYATSGFGGTNAADVVVTVHVPDGARPDLVARTHVGDVRVTDVMVGNATASVDVGDLRILRADLAGDLDARVDVGSAVVQLDSVQSGTLGVTADVGDVELRLPTRADVGYDVTAQSGVGSVEVRLGETEDYREEDEPTGGNVHARTRGYDAKPTKVQVTVTSDVGDVLVAT